MAAAQYAQRPSPAILIRHERESVSMSHVDKDEFPTVEVYGPTEEPTLRLITCGGDFDGSARSYEGNLIVFAEFVGLETPPEAPTA
ncbi:MAG: hypothetical protein OES57_06985 [Acidimicrobiia bacterium]|nr:hypothetical protein [Acidimicrobiia bacterium]